MKKLILIVIIFSAAAGFAFPQAMPGGFASPQNIASQGRFRSVSDNYIRPDAYSGVRFKKYFFMTSFENANKATFGFATRVNKLYIGIGYIGTFWANYTNYNFTEIQSNPWGTGIKTFSEYKDTITPTSPRPENRIALLFGLPSMAFRFTYTTSHESFSKENIFFEDEYYKNNSAALGMHSVQLAWVLAKNLTSKGIKPWFTLDVNFISDYQKYAKYESNGATLGSQIDHSKDNITMYFDTSLGGVALYRNQSGFSASTDLAYNLRMIFIIMITAIPTA